MKHLYENNKIEISKLKHSKRMNKIGFAIFALCSIIIIGVMFINIVEQREKEKKQDEVINKLSYENTNLQKINNEIKNQINGLSNQNNELRRIYNNYTQARQQYIKPEQIEPKIQEQKYTQEKSKIAEPKIYDQQNIYTTPKYQTPKYKAPKKMYNRYTVAKLVSDSKVEVMPDNRLKSNMNIYGRYTERPVTSIECGKNERIYKIQNECTGIAFPLDIVYFKKSNANNIQNYNRKTHMVECLYDYENGLMHDCDVKLIGIQ